MFLKKIIKIIQKTEFSLFLTAIFLLRIPPFFLVPFTSNPLLSSHSLGRYLIIWLFFSDLLLIFFNYKKLGIPRGALILVLFYFATQSLSVLEAINILAFMLQYKNLVFGLLIFITALLAIDNEKRLNLTVQVIISSIVANLIFQTIIYFQPMLLVRVLQQFLYESYWEVLRLNLERERFFVDIYDAALLPLIFMLALKVRRLKDKLLHGLLMAVVTFFALVSNFRTQLLMALFSLLISFALLLHRNVKKIAYVFIFLLVFYIGFKVSLRIVGYNAFDRLLLQETEDVRTITGRFEHWQESIEMANGSPLLGVGLGNYYDNLSTKTVFTTSILNWKNTLGRITATHPHSIFFGTLAETGYLGLLSYLALLLYFFITDLKYLQLKKQAPLPFIISFWSLSIYAAFNPPVTLPYFLLFWLLRVFIIKSSIIA